MVFMCRDTMEGETEIFANEHIRICIIMKRFEDNPKLINLLYRYYCVDEECTNVELIVR